MITPRVAGRVEVPPVRYPYFDPYARQYEVAESAPVAIFIAAGTLASADTSTATVGAALDAATSVSRCAAAAALSLAARCCSRCCCFLCPCCCSSARGDLVVARCEWRRRRCRCARSRATSVAVREARTVRRTFLSAVADRLSASSTVIAEPAALNHLALRAGVTAETADRASDFIAELNAAAFDVAGEWAGDGVKRAYDLYRAIDREARPRRLPRARTAALAVVLALAIAAGAHAADDAHALFERGVDAYAHSQFASSANDFQRAHRARAARSRRMGKHGHRGVCGRRHRARAGRMAARAAPRAPRGRRARAARSHLADGAVFAGLRPRNSAAPARGTLGVAVDCGMARARVAGTQARCDGAVAAAHGSRRRDGRRTLLRGRHSSARSTHQCHRSRRRRARRRRSTCSRRSAPTAARRCARAT